MTEKCPHCSVEPKIYIERTGEALHEKAQYGCIKCGLRAPFYKSKSSRNVDWSYEFLEEQAAFNWNMMIEDMMYGKLNT